MDQIKARRQKGEKRLTTTCTLNLTLNDDVNFFKKISPKHNSRPDLTNRYHPKWSSLAERGLAERSFITSTPLHWVQFEPKVVLHLSRCQVQIYFLLLFQNVVMFVFGFGCRTWHAYVHTEPDTVWLAWRLKGREGGGVIKS